MKYRFGKDIAKSFVVRYRGLKSFVMPYVQLHYLITPLFAVREGEGVGLSMSKLESAELSSTRRQRHRRDPPQVSRSKPPTREYIPREHIKESRAPHATSNLETVRDQPSPQISPTMG